ncbi:hypothetical protein BC793_12660 [Actinoplanes xinjiangensis]|uniref:Uncharacterized protein n=2 Tax=Actinoplanes xinjiangensis TaxID=512350 RepID=A0A316EU28_9ACTN|nr:hypothetical protein BC793_12660 [Actinoplanes xinjiangensis]
MDPMAESVISFGAGDSPRRAILRDLGRDRRLPGLVAGLGAVAAFGSLISEWQSTAIRELGVDGEQLPEERVLLANLLDLGGVGAGYLIGLLLLAVAVVLTLFGPAPGRAYTRVAGFALGGVLLALLLSLVQYLNETSALLPKYLMAFNVTEEDSLRTAHGRGLWCALAAVTLALVALWMPARTVAEDPEPPVTEADDALDVTITPTTPFASYPGELDQPHRS